MSQLALDDERSLWQSLKRRALMHIGIFVVVTVGVLMSFELFKAWVENAWGSNAVYPIPLAVFLLAGLTIVLGSIFISFPYFVVFSIATRIYYAVWGYLWVSLLLSLMGIASFTIAIATSWPGLDRIVQYGIVTWVRTPLNEALNVLVSMSLMSPFHVRIDSAQFSTFAEAVNAQYYSILFLFFLALLGARVGKLLFGIKKRTSSAMISAALLFLGALEIVAFDKPSQGLLLANTSNIFVSYPNDTMWACRANWAILLTASIVGRILDFIHTVIHHDSMKKTRTDIRRR